MILLCFSGLRVDAAPRTWVGIELERGHNGGVGIRGVVPGSPAASTTLAAGDEVLAVDSEDVHSATELQLAISTRPVGRRLSLKVRDPKGALRDVTLAPAARPDEAALARARLLGRRAPAFTLPRVGATDAHESLERHRGRAVLLDFWATWCGPCVRSLPRLGELQARYGKRGLVVLGISTEPAPTLLQAMKRYGVTHPILSDSNEATFGNYGILALPTLVLIDGNGVVAAVEVGGDLDAIEAALPRALPQGKKP